MQKVCVWMIRSSSDLGAELQTKTRTGARTSAAWTPPPRPRPLAARLTDEERARHEAFVETLGDDPIWRRG